MQILKNLFSTQQPVQVFTDAELQALRERNEQRLLRAKTELGTKYLLHPANKISRKKKVVAS